MTPYERKISRLKEVLYKNQGQIDTIIGIRNYIDHNYENDLNLDMLAKMRFVSKYHLLRLFKKYYGLTPRQYLINKRIEASKKHLRNGMKVTETCFAVGFDSLGSFSALFKTKTGRSPTQFQKEQLSRSNNVTDS